MGPRNILPVHKNDASRQDGPTNKHKHSSKHSKPKPSRMLPNGIKNELLAFIAEFCGTFMFLYFAFGATQTANNSVESAAATTGPSIVVVLYIALGFGFSLAINVWCFFRVSGGLFNPVVTLGLYLVGAVTGIRAVLCFIAQMCGGMAAAGLASAMLPGPLTVATRLTGGTTVAQGVFLEMFLTTELMFTIYMLAAEKHKATFLAPVGIGLALFVAEMMGVFYTGGSLNPARSFGPDTVLGFPGYHWIYWIGPLMGTLIAFGFYRLIKDFEYETVNPGQDFDDNEAAVFQPPENPQSREDVQRPNVAAEAVRESLSPVTSGLGSREGEEGRSLGSFGWERGYELEEGRGGSIGRHSSGMGRHNSVGRDGVRPVSSADRYRGAS